jgi:hypothetical protein
VGHKGAAVEPDWMVQGKGCVNPCLTFFLRHASSMRTLSTLCLHPAGRMRGALWKVPFALLR